MKIEILGLGDVKLIALTEKQQKYKVVNKDGKELESRREGNVSYFWVDDEGKKYNENEVFDEIAGKKIPRTTNIAKTEKVERFDVVDKSSIIGDFKSEGYYICDVNNTFLRNWNKEIGEDKAITFKFKKVDRGRKFHRAYMYQFRNGLILVSGVGLISEGIKQYTLMKQASKESKIKIIKDVIELEAEEIENLIQI